MLYLDTSFLTPLFRPEPTSRAVEEFLDRQPAGTLAISHWTRLEFASVLAREVRMRALDAAAAVRLEAEFAAVMSESLTTVTPTGADFDLALNYIRRYDGGLRADDALHLAIGSNNNAAQILSLDKALLRAGELLELPVSAGIEP